MNDIEKFKIYLNGIGAEYTIDGDIAKIKYAPAGTANQIRDLPYRVDILEHKNIDNSTLLVRVAGFSAYFCDMHPEVQDQIIKRTKQRL